jgi:hypothetical protein
MHKGVKTASSQRVAVPHLYAPVVLDTYAVLSELGALDEIIPATGQTAQRLVDVGYGRTGVEVGGGRPRPAFPLERRRAEQRYAPGARAASGRRGRAGRDADPAGRRVVGEARRVKVYCIIVWRRVNRYGVWLNHSAFLAAALLKFVEHPTDLANGGRCRAQPPQQ